ncbi:MAG: hypothetical protein ACK56I_01110, partial [bacterium]
MEVSGDTGCDGKQNPLYLLSRRLVFYPLIDVITRIGAVWYESVYALHGSSYGDGASAAQTSSYVLFCILTPLGGILDLAVLLS